jgi:membrane associated rhomboid family serine protease
MNDRFRFYAIGLSLLCVVIFIIQVLLPSVTEALVLNASAWTQVWRFVTSIFLHGGLGHLLYNCFALVLFGSILERLIGSRRFLVVFFVSGIVANLVSVNFYSSSLGASGAIFGVIGALIIVRPLLTVWAFGLPMPLFIAGIVWAAGDVIGIFVPSNVGNIAHLVGLACGLALGVLYRDWNTPRVHKQRVQLDEHSVRQWEDRYLR